MVAVWGVAAFVAGLALLAVELAYPRRYLGILGIDLAVLGLLAMFVPESLGFAPRVAIYLGGTVLATLVAVPFYRRYAPHVGPMLSPDVTAGDMAVVVEPITPTREGLVRAGGIVWSARADHDVAAGAKVRILVIETDRLWVEPELDAAPQDRQGREDDHGAHDGQRG